MKEDVGALVWTLVRFGFRVWRFVIDYVLRGCQFASVICR